MSLQGELDRENHPLQDMLLQMPGPDGNPLFASTAELARRIAQLPGIEYTGRQQSVSSLLAQVFRGRRSCPDPLREGILQAVRMRLRSESAIIVKQWMQQVERGIAALNQVRKLQSASKPSSRFSPDLEQTANRFVISSFFSEVKGTATGKKVIAHMVDILRMRIPEETPCFRYVLCLPTAQDVMDYWRALFEELTQPSAPRETRVLTGTEAANVLQSRDDEDYLCLYQLPYFLCLSTIALYNPEREDIAGFTLFYQENGKIEVTEMPGRYLAGWRRFYADFVVGNIAQERIPFRRFRGLLYI